MVEGKKLHGKCGKSILKLLFEAFHALAHGPPSIDEEHFALIEKFVVLLYDRTSSLHLVNEVRKQLFTQKTQIY